MSHPAVTEHHRVGLPQHRDRSGRHDIQGLRALAVVAVVLDHLCGWPGGGFVGVDVFFVISGFLITGLLLREHERTGHISFVGFYRRRVKRIMPAAIVVLVLTVLGARLIFLQSRFQSIAVDSVWALLFSANWHFAAASTDYFEQNRPVSPVQHFWSLSVEEQFYLLWPWVMLATFALFRARRRRQARVAVLGTIVGISLVSFVWALHQSATTAEVAYFSTLTRVWELGLGAALAVSAPALHRIPDRLRPALAWLGLLGIMLAAALLSETAGFPAPAAALPVLATAVVIAAGTHADPHRQQSLLAPLTNPVSRYLGDISYSLYLWHFPVIVLLGAYLGGASGAWYYVAALAVMLAASIGTYHLVDSRCATPRCWRGSIPVSCAEPPSPCGGGAGARPSAERPASPPCWAFSWWWRQRCWSRRTRRRPPRRPTTATVATTRPRVRRHPRNG